ncbi:class D beta-lactamase [Rhodobacteraceae bacterium RKSG542]|uniref:class D beta-lactamase n=1 Tax=Pseudovibrio flavus TaxID=2529854 RepID=UPI0012BBBF8F|nr:class D beta-lactamase [Pseudovibrio flavus]MTI16020.1 class D beta-lactamase [Pseudovibrio flavus]
MKTTIRAALTLGALSLLFSGAAHASEPTIIERNDLETIFSQAGVVGTFSMLDTDKNELTVVNSERAAERFVPASSFKIANALIALETGNVTDVNEVVPIGDQEVFLEVWAEPMGIGRGMQVSNVPVYQEVAKKTGLETYQHWLAELNYGNADTGPEVDRFWLDGPLEVSANEQALFLGKLSQTKLPLKPEVQKTVQDITVLQETDNYTLHGKTGWGTASEPGIGWFVGWVAKGDNTYAFALNMDMDDADQLPLRTELADKLLTELGVK